MIVETYGAGETYLNQVFVMAAQDEEEDYSQEEGAYERDERTELAVEDLHSPMKISFPHPHP